MAAAGADALVLTHLPNIFYLCGFTGSNAILLVLARCRCICSPTAATRSRLARRRRRRRVHIVRTALAEACGEHSALAIARESACASAFESASVERRRMDPPQEGGRAAVSHGKRPRTWWKASAR